MDSSFIRQIQHPVKLETVSAAGENPADEKTGETTTQILLPPNFLSSQPPSTLTMSSSPMTTVIQQMPQPQTVAHITLHNNRIISAQPMAQTETIVTTPRQPLPDKKPTFCEICQKGFSTNYVMERHKKSVHDKIREFECTLCSYASSSRSHLKKHIKSVHDKLKDFACTMCEFKTAIKGSLDRHIRIVHMKQKYKCSFCEQEYNQKWRMSRHLRTTHFGEKLYPCHLCPYSGESKRRLTTHHKNAHNIHTTEIPNARRHLTKNVQDVGAGAVATITQPISSVENTTTYEVVSATGVPQGTATIAHISADRQIIVQQS